MSETATAPSSAASSSSGSSPGSSPTPAASSGSPAAPSTPSSSPATPGAGSAPPDSAPGSGASESALGVGSAPGSTPSPGGGGAGSDAGGVALPANGDAGSDFPLLGGPSALPGLREPGKEVQIRPIPIPEGPPTGHGGMELESAAQRMQRKLDEAAGKVPPPPADPNAPADPTAPAGEPFQFMGKTYKTQADAENRMRTLESKLRQTSSEREQAIKVANQWRDFHEGENARASAAAPGGVAPSGPAADPNAQTTPQAAPQSGATPQPATPPANFAESFDWQTFSDLYSDPKRGPAYAMGFLMQSQEAHASQRENALVERLRQEYGPPIAQAQQTAQQQQAATTIVNMWNNASNLRDPDSGDLVMPELQDPAMKEEVAKLWLTYPPEFARTEQGMWSAYLTWRDWRIRQGTLPTSGAVSAPGGTDPAAQAAATANSVIQANNQSGVAAASGVGVGASHSLSPVAPGKAPSEASLIKESFRRPAFLIDPHGQSLGFKS